DLFELAPIQGPQVRAGDREDGELHARRAGVQDADHLGHCSPLASGDACSPPPGWPVRRAWARRRPMAQEANRVRTLSAPLVNTIGPRAPRTMPAPSALAMRVSCLASMLPASRSGTSRMSASPATSERICLTSAAVLLMALSIASGPSSRPPVIWPRSAI